MKETNLEFYKVTVFPERLYASETWVKKNENDNKIQTAETIFLRNVKGITRLNKTRKHTEG